MYWLESIWKFILLGLVVIVAITSAVFAFPLKTVEIQVYEKYYDTEMKTESYQESEPYVEEELQEKTEILYEGFHTTVPEGIWVPFVVDKSGAILIASFECTVPGAFYVYGPTNHILFEQRGSSGAFELHLAEAEYKARFRERVMYGEQVHIRLILKWSEYVEITRYKDVTRYREVPVQIEKKRPIIEDKKVSMWKFISGNY